MVLRKWESRSLPSLREAFQFLKAEMLLFFVSASYLDGSDLLSHLRSTMYLVLVCYANALPMVAWRPSGTALVRILTSPQYACTCVLSVSSQAFVQLHQIIIKLNGIILSTITLDCSIWNTTVHLWFIILIVLASGCYHPGHNVWTNSISSS